jgi:hypothetical protein
MIFTTIFIGDSILLWPLIIAVAHSIWNVWYNKSCTEGGEEGQQWQEGAIVV